MNKYFSAIADKLLADGTQDDIQASQFFSSGNQPVIWLLGKTGAGKTSLVRCLTGLDSAEVGNGFEPCTRTTSEFEFPVDEPLMRFLDTRGLDETGYDPTEDLRECEGRSHVAIVLARIDDPVQHTIADALEQIKKRSPKTPVIIVHNGADTIVDKQERRRSRYANQQQFELAVGESLTNVETAMPRENIGSHAHGIAALLDELIELIPDVALLLAQDELENLEKQDYQIVRPKVIRYSSAAGSADLIPAMGAVAVPAIQAGLLRALGQHYELPWTRRRLSEFSLALGVSVLVRFGSSYLTRQLAKLIPVYGQTVGAVAAGTISFASTFALGRSAAYYLYQVRHGRRVDQDELREVYKTALKKAIKTKFYEDKDK